MKTEMQRELLSKIARQSLMLNRVGGVNDSVIYQVGEGWHREVLLEDENVVVVKGSIEFEEAVQGPNSPTIFVPKDAALTQEIVERILERNPLSGKTIFWEV